MLAQKTLQAFRQGYHQTKKNTTDYQFSQFRNYTPGDDVRLIDWKVYGKTQKLYIKQSIAQQQIMVSLIPDLSASMQYEEAGISKLNYSKYLFACLANLAFRQGDTVQILHQKPYQQILDALIALTNLTAANFWIDYEKLYATSLMNKHKNLLIYCSDFYEYHDEMMTWLAAHTKKGNEVIAFHVVGHQEKEMSFSKNTILVDLETKETQRLDKTIIQEGKANFLIQQQRLKQQLSQLNIHYVEMIMNKPVQDALIQYLTYRNQYVS